MSTTAPILLEAQGVAKHYGKFVALGGVDLKVRANTVHSVIGPNGAGKTTLFHMLTGTKAVSGGRILFDGHDVTREPDHRRVRRGMARSFQVTSLFLTLPVRENLRLAAQFVEAGRGLLRHVSASRAAQQRVEELIERFSLQARANELAGFLSHGEQRRLEIAVALAARPRLLLLDEPTQGMSHADTQDTAELISGLADEGLSILLVEHDVDLVMNLSDHVVVMHQGAKLAEGRPQAVRADPAVQAAYFGEAAHA